MRWLTFGAATLGWMLDGVEQGIFPLIARPALQEMLAVHGDRLVGVWMGWLTALFLLGAAAGGACFGWLGDRIGRVRTMALSILVYSIFTGACYFAREPWQLGICRLVASLGMGGQWSLGVALVMETWSEADRPWLAGAIGAAANIGYVLIAVVAYFVPITASSWRWIMLVGTAPAVLALAIRYYVPESQRWQTAVAGGTSRPLREIFAAGIRGHTLMGIALSSIALIGTWGSVQWIPLWADKITGGVVPTAKAMVLILLASGAIVGCFAGSICGKYGRRRAFCLMCLVSYGLCWVLFHEITTCGTAFWIVTFLIGASSASFYGWLPLYLPELFPTRIRATAQGVSFNAGRILAAVGAVGAGQLVSLYGGNYARMGLTITLIYLVGAGLVWFAPETKGKPLPL